VSILSIQLNPIGFVKTKFAGEEIDCNGTDCSCKTSNLVTEKQCCSKNDKITNVSVPPGGGME
jgi:hypothetical protein